MGGRNPSGLMRFVGILLSEFHRLRSLGIKFSISILRMLWKHLIDTLSSTSEYRSTGETYPRFGWKQVSAAVHEIKSYYISCTESNSQYQYEKGGTGGYLALILSRKSEASTRWWDSNTGICLSRWWNAFYGGYQWKKNIGNERG